MAVVDPNSSATASSAVTAATTTVPASSRPVTSPSPVPPSSRPVSPLPQHVHNARHHPSPALYTAQALPIRAANPHPNSQLPKSHDPAPGVVYPVASSGRGFIPKGIRPEQMVTVANPGGYTSPSVVFSHAVRPLSSPHLEYMNHPLHMTRPSNLQYPHMGSSGGIGSAHMKGVPVSVHTKASPRSTISDSNGYKDARERSRDDTLSVVYDRKVRITENASLYALCRSWLRNSAYEESQPLQNDVMKTLPKPLPASMVASYMSNKKEDKEDDEEKEEDEKSIEDLSAQDLLQKHVKRAKKVRARLRQERLQRIARYRGRLRLLLPPPVEQFRNETAAGN